ncbi:hypothetical protein CapIbe_021705 [Capra ibex]
MSPARVRSARAAQVAAFPEAYRPGGKNLSSEKGGECVRAGEKPRRKPEQPLQTGLDDLYFSCSPPTSGCDLF